MTFFFFFFGINYYFQQNDHSPEVPDNDFIHVTNNDEINTVNVIIKVL